MQYSHVVTELVLAIVCLFVFFNYLLKLEFSATVLWESFILSIGAAAIFGAIGYAGYSDANDLYDMFQRIATTVGTISLVAASWFLINERDISYKQAVFVLILGLIFLVFTENGISASQIRQIATVAMTLVFIIAIYGFTKGKSKASAYLVLGVVFFILAFNTDRFIINEDTSIDAYHLLLAGGVLFFGIAASNHKYKIN